MARITVNETGSQPTLLISTTVGNAAQLAAGNITVSGALNVGCLQDITITSSTGIYSYIDFCSTDTNKITTPADNEISTNIVIDDVKYFGANTIAGGTASNIGVAKLSQDKIEVQFKLIWNNASGNGNVANAYFTSGKGYISSLAPTVSPDAPVWMTPMTIAVDGTMYNGQNP
jgi:hypothetical protein